MSCPFPSLLGSKLTFLFFQEIEEACKRIMKEGGAVADQAGEVVAVPLYSTLPPAMQQKIFDQAPAPRRPGGPPGRKVCY
jgi:pre-mRNA-splicing factor ATP-dependent RNA helicase DHX15/PRP43